MYNFNLEKDEKLIEIFDDILIANNESEKNTTIALTNHRILFLDYINTNDALEALRITKGINYIRYKEIYYQINLEDIELTKEDNYYKVFINNKIIFIFYNQELYKLLKKQISQN